MTYCIYIITNVHDGKVYVGYTKNAKKRWEKHKKTALSTTCKKQRLHCAIAKHGIEAFSFQVIEENIETIALAWERERFWISHHSSYSDNAKGYNMTPGGEGGPTFLGRNHTDEFKRRMSAIQNNRSEEWKKNFKAAHQNRSEEWRKNMSNAQRNKPPVSAETKARMRKAWEKRIAEGRVITPTGRAKISAAHKGKTCPQKTKNSVSNARKLSLLKQDVNILENDLKLSDRAMKRFRERLASGYWNEFQFKCVDRCTELEIEDLLKRLTCRQSGPPGPV